MKIIEKFLKYTVISLGIVFLYYLTLYITNSDFNPMYCILFVMLCVLSLTVCRIEAKLKLYESEITSLLNLYKSNSECIIDLHEMIKIVLEESHNEENSESK